MPKAAKVFPNANSNGPTLEDVADLIKQNKAKNIVILVGAGISTSAGIPDFRSPETGLYANLAQYNLPYAEAIFDIQYFLQHPEAFFTLAKEIYPGNYHPTLTHYFFVLLHKKGLLKRLFTQNVDTLERMAGLPEEMLVEAHGSFATAHCLNCRQEYQAEELRPRIAKGEILRCHKPSCKKSMKGLIKSDIVFFGESLPSVFFKRLSDFRSCDLLITIGTSLKVHPFASLIERVGDDVPRLLINLESVGEIDEYDVSDSSGFGGSYREEGFDFNGISRGGKEFSRDAKWLGESDKGILEFVKLLGWENELMDLYEEGKKSYDEGKQHLRTASSSGSPTPAKNATTQPAETLGIASESATEKDEEEIEIARTEKGVDDVTTIAGENASSAKIGKTESEFEKDVEEEADKGLEDAKREAKKVAKEIGQVVDEPKTEERQGTVGKGEEEISIKLASELDNLKLKETDT